MQLGLFPNRRYAGGRGALGSVDLQVPRTSGRYPPVVVVVHGGGWNAGDKADATIAPFIRACNEAGLATASVNYRLAPAVRWPAPAEDIELAISWMRSRAVAGYAGDTSRIAMLGVSAGAHLAAAVALRARVAHVAGVVGICGPYDLTTLAAQSPTYDWGAGSQLEQLLGSSPAANRRLALDASPLYGPAPRRPFMLVHGDQDPIVSIQQSTAMRDRIAVAGGRVVMETIPGGGHGGDLVINAGVARRAAAFLRAALVA